MVYRLCCVDVIEDLGKNLTLSNFVMSVLRLMLPSMLFLILGFFGFLHSWLNGWAELTRFPDRIFYLDWWNSAEFGTYYRKWNIVVHDWLYYYVYLDLNRFVFQSSKRSRFYSKISTFLISAIIHELILIEASGFFYPVLFLMFTGPGISLYYFRHCSNTKSASTDDIIRKFLLLDRDVSRHIAAIRPLPDGVLREEGRKLVNDQR